MEVVADETYFIPWESNFIVGRSKKVTVNIEEQVMDSKPKVNVTVGRVTPTTKIRRIIKNPPKNISLRKPITEITKALLKYGITPKTIKSNPATAGQIVSEYLNENKKYLSNKNEILKKVLTLMLSHRK